MDSPTERILARREKSESASCVKIATHRDRSFAPFCPSDVVGRPDLQVHVSNWHQQQLFTQFSADCDAVRGRVPISAEIAFKTITAAKYPNIVLTLSMATFANSSASTIPQAAT